MQAATVLDKDMIDQPDLWRIMLQLDESSIDVVVMCNVRDDSLIYRHIELDYSSGTRLDAIENVIYANPLLLSDFSRVDILICSSISEILPECISKDAECRQILDILFPDAEPDERITLTDSVAGLDMCIAMQIPTDIVGFLRRTFNNPRIHHPLSSLCSYFAGQNRFGNARKMLAYFTPDRLDIIVTNNNAQPYANSFVCNDTMDAVYYIMAIHRLMHLDSKSDEVFIAGDNDRRNQAASILREYLPYVMPMIFPAAMHKAGRDALHAPLPLILIPLCE